MGRWLLLFLGLFASVLSAHVPSEFTFFIDLDRHEVKVNFMPSTALEIIGVIDPSSLTNRQVNISEYDQELTTFFGIISNSNPILIQLTWLLIGLILKEGTLISLCDY